MAVVSVRERFQARRSSYRNGVLTHLREWLVTCDNATDGTAVALTANDGTRQIPPPGTGHPKDSSATLTNLDADPHESSDRHFLVKGEYVSTSGVGQPASPLDRPPDISYGANESQEPYFLDRSAEPKPVVNTAGDPFEQYLERDRGETIITIAINEPTHDPVAAETFSQTTNVSAVTIDGTVYAAGTLKLSPITAAKVTERVEDNGVVTDFTYYRRTYVLKARHEGWKDKPLDVGLNELIPDPDPTKPAKLKPIVDGVNGPVRRPWPLDGQGRKKPNPTDKPEELEFMPYTEVAWTSLAFTNPVVWQT